MLIYHAFIQSPGETFLNLGFLSIRWYGFLISISVLIGLFISKKLAKERNIDPLYISEFLPLLITCSIIGARAYYVIFEWRQYSGDNFFSYLELFNNSIEIPTRYTIDIYMVNSYGYKEERYKLFFSRLQAKNFFAKSRSKNMINPNKKTANF